MKYRNWTAACAGLAALSTVACGNGPTAGEAGDANRRVYIDPETGERRQPTAEERAQMREQAKANRKAGDNDKSQVVDGPNGTKMIIHDKDDWMKQRTDESDESRSQ